MSRAQEQRGQTSDVAVDADKVTHVELVVVPQDGFFALGEELLDVAGAEGVEEVVELGVCADFFEDFEGGGGSCGLGEG